MDKNEVVTKVQFIKLDEYIEEEVIISVHGYKLICFANIVPYGLVEGESYQVVLSPFTIDDDCVEEQEYDLEESITRQEQKGYYAYVIKGKLMKGILYSCGFRFSDEFWESEYAYLDGKTISIYVDRIGIEFLSQSPAMSYL